MSTTPSASSTGDTPATEPSTETPQPEDVTWFDVLHFLAQRVFLYFVVYALSIGPMYWPWYKSRFIDGSSLLAAFYLPLAWLAESVPPFGDWMEWYINLWIG